MGLSLRSYRDWSAHPIVRFWHGGWGLGKGRVDFLPDSENMFAFGEVYVEVLNIFANGFDLLDQGIEHGED